TWRIYPFGNNEVHFAGDGKRLVACGVTTAASFVEGGLLTRASFGRHAVAPFRRPCVASRGGTMTIADDSGIFRLASVGSYLDALSSITAEMTLKERSDLIHLDKCLHRLWGLGQNVILGWCLE